MVNKGLFQLNKQCQTRLKEAATIPQTSYGPEGRGSNPSGRTKTAEIQWISAVLLLISVLFGWLDFAVDS